MGKGARNRLNRTGAKQTLAYRDARRQVLREVNQELTKATDRFFYNKIIFGKVKNFEDYKKQK